MIRRILLLAVMIGLVSMVEVWEKNSKGKNAVLPEPTVNNNKFELVEIARNLFVPWSLAFTSSNRALVSERNGYIRQLVNNQLQTEPVFYFEEVASEGEGGLMGLAAHPQYSQNHYIYAMLSYWKNGDMWIKIERLIDNGNKLERDKIIIDNIKAAFNHDGGRIHFGPDGKLYVSTGDASNGDLAQNVKALEGKILRLNDDGTIPQDNPFPGSAVYSLGHRNVQGFDWHPVSKRLYATEHGPSGFDGPPGGDEINFIEAGANYGWPKLSHDQIAPWVRSPLITYTPAIAPAGAHFYSGKMFPWLTNHFLVAGLRGTGLYDVVIDDREKPAILSSNKITGIDIGRIRDVVINEVGQIYLLTSNRDGRGNINEGDDKIYLMREMK